MEINTYEYEYLGIINNALSYLSKEPDQNVTLRKINLKYMYCNA